MILRQICSLAVGIIAKNRDIKEGNWGVNIFLAEGVIWALARFCAFFNPYKFSYFLIL